MAKKYLDQAGLKTLIQSLATKISQKASGTVISIKSGNVNNLTVNSTDPANPVIGLSDELSLRMNTLWEIALNSGIIVKEDTPVAVIDYVAEKLANLVPNALYNIEGIAMYSNANGNIAFYQSWIGSTIDIIKKATSLSRQDSDSVALVIKSRPATPTTVNSPIKGKLAGLTTSMEYKISTSTVWANCTATSIVSLFAGSYNVRIKATSSAFSSAIVTVVVT
jgi:hypothetical protein